MLANEMVKESFFTTAEKTITRYDKEIFYPFDVCLKCSCSRHKGTYNSHKHIKSLDINQITFSSHKLFFMPRCDYWSVLSSKSNRKGQYGPMPGCPYVLEHTLCAKKKFLLTSDRDLGRLKDAVDKGRAVVIISEYNLSIFCLINQTLDEAEYNDLFHLYDNYFVSKDNEKYKFLSSQINKETLINLIKSLSFTNIEHLGRMINVKHAVKKIRK